MKLFKSFISDFFEIIVSLKVNLQIQSSHLMGKDALGDLAIWDSSTGLGLVSSQNLNIALKIILEKELCTYISSMIGMRENVKFFVCYDGLDYISISKEVILPAWFYDKYYINEFFVIANEW